MVKVLAISGSPRKGGNSEMLLDKFLEGAKASGCAVEKLRADVLNIAPCDEGNSCFRTGVCRVQDDMQAVYQKLIEADCLVIATPTFFMAPPAQLKRLIDRCQSLWAKRFILKQPLRADDKERKGYLIGTAGLNKREAFTATRIIMKAFFYVLGFKYTEELLFEGVDSRGDIEKRQGALESAHSLGKSVKA